MTFKEFKSNFIKFLEDSNVNLGRRTSKKRQKFLGSASKMFNDYDKQPESVPDSSVNEQSNTSPTHKSVIRIEPNSRKRALDVGKGVHAMTPSESMRADEQRNHPPVVAKKEKKNG